MGFEQLIQITWHSKKLFVQSEGSMERGSEKVRDVKFINPISCHGSYVPTCGNDHAIYTANSCTTNASSYTNNGDAPKNESGMKGQELLAGEYTVALKEKGVFSIKFEIDSMKLNLTPNNGAL
jgi:hypothetical protein